MFENALVNILSEHRASCFWNHLFHFFPRGEVTEQKKFRPITMDVDSGFYIINEPHGFAYVESKKDIARIYTKSNDLNLNFKLKNDDHNIVVDKKDEWERFCLIGKIAEMDEKGDPFFVNEDKFLFPVLDEALEGSGLLASAELMMNKQFEYKMLCDRIEDLESRFSSFGFKEDEEISVKNKKVTRVVKKSKEQFQSGSLNNHIGKPLRAVLNGDLKKYKIVPSCKKHIPVSNVA